MDDPTDADELSSVTPESSATWPVWLGGALILLACLGLAWLSRFFVYGEGHAERPIAALCSLLLLAWAGYALAWRFRHRLAGLPTRRALWWILGIGLTARAMLLPVPPIQEADFYRYQWDGMVARAGIHPWRHAPAELTPEQVETRESELAAARLVHDRVSFPEVRTIYPSVAQGVFWLNAQLFGWRQWGMRLTFLAADLALLALLALLLRAYGRPLYDLLLYAWCPLVLKEVTNSMHLDIIAALALGAFAWAVLRQRPWLAAVALWAATFTKLTPAILGPLWLAWCLGRRDWRGAVGGCVIGLGLSAASLWWMTHGIDDPLSGLRAFSQDWQVNAALFPSGVLAYDVVLDLPAEKAGQAMRMTYGVAVLLAGLVAAVIVGRGPSAPRVWTASLALLMVVWCLGPVGNPWYLCWLLPFMVLLRAWPAGLLMGCTALYYYDFALLYAEPPVGESAYRLLAIVEYAPFYAAIAIAGWRICRRRWFSDMET